MLTDDRNCAGFTSVDCWRDTLATVGWCEVEVSDQPAFLGLADQLGRRIPSWRGGTTVDRLTVRRSDDAPANSFSHIFGEGAFPFHTDMARHACPPRYIIMRLGSTSDNVRPTLLIDFQRLSLSAAEKQALKSEVWIVKGRPAFVASVITDCGVTPSLVRYDPVCMRPATKDAAAADKCIQNSLRIEAAVSYGWRQHRALIIDNWRVLHARPGDFEADDNCRVLERVQVVAEVEP